MTNTMIGLIGLVSMLGLLALRVPVGFALISVGMIGLHFVHWNPMAPFNTLSREAFGLSIRYELIVIPLFILMGNAATEAGMSRRLYDAAYAVIGSFRGGLASATVVACGGFSALCGSSVAATLTMGRVSLSEMDRFGYDRRLATGVVAAGGTLGILIPPSTGFVIYGILTQQSIGRLFLAGVLPGLLLILLFIIVVTIIAFIKEEYAPRGPKTKLSEKGRAMLGAVPIVGIVVLTVAGIYRGFFSPLQAAGVAAGFVIIYGFLSRELTIKGLVNAVRDTIKTTATIFIIIIGAYVFNPFLEFSGLTHTIGDFFLGLDVSDLVRLILILLCYMVLGMFMEGFALMVVSLPIFLPVIIGMGFDPIWYGVVMVVVLEMAFISPPVGINVFVVKSVVPHVPLKDIYIGILPFWGAMIVLLGFLIAFPEIALYLPNQMLR